MNLRIFTFVIFGFIFQVFAQDISVDDLKLLESYQVSHLRDFVRGKGRGFVSRVSIDDLLNGDGTLPDDEFFNQAEPTPTPPSPQEEMDPNDPDVVILGGQFNMNMEEDPNIRTIPLLPPSNPPTKKLRPGEHLIIPHIIMPSSTTLPSTAPPRRKHKGEWKEMDDRRGNRRRNQSGKKKNGEKQPSNEDFEELARILQYFRQSQKSTTKAPTVPPSPAPTPRPKSFPITTANPLETSKPTFRRFGLPIIIEQENIDTQEFVVSPLREKWEGLAQPLGGSRPHLFGGINIKPSRVSTTPSPSTPTPHKEKNGFYLQESGPAPIAAGDLIPISENEWESKMREISKKLGNYLISIKKKKEREGTLPKGSYQVNGVVSSRNNPFGIRPNDNMIRLKERSQQRAFVTILREGIIHQTTQNQYNLVASITLIRDSGKVILVDTGLATDINGRTDLIEKLSKLNIVPPKVDFVVITHGHPDHAGNTNDFPDSTHIQGNFIHHGTKFNISDIKTSGSLSLTSNVKVIRTPGHTDEDLSVIVRNTDKYGTIAIAGDIFMNEKDLDYPLMWKKFSFDQRLQEQSRKELICLANFIIPGHGGVFQVTPSMKHGVNCNKSSRNSKKRI